MFNEHLDQSLGHLDFGLFHPDVFKCSQFVQQSKERPLERAPSSPPPTQSLPRCVQISSTSFTVFVPLWVCFFTCFSCFCCRIHLALRVHYDCGHFCSSAFWLSMLCLVSSFCCFISCGFLCIRSSRKRDTHINLRVVSRKYVTSKQSSSCGWLGVEHCC